MSNHDALDLDLDAVEKAFGAYLTTIIGGSAREEKVTFQDLADGRIISEALHHEQPDHFSSPSTPSSSSTSLSNLKRIYHQLLTCPSCTLATHLPVPDLETISRAASPNPSSSTSTNPKAETYKSELVNLLRIVLLVQTVWSTQNAGVIGVITELGVDEQKVLKEMIEAGLSDIPTPETNSADEVDVQAEQIYLAQIERRRKEEEFDRVRTKLDVVEAELERVREASTIVSSSRQRPIGSKSSTPSRRRPSSPDQNAESSDETTPALQLTTSSNSDPPEDTPMTTLPITPLRKRPVNGLAVSGSASTPASPMERMKNLEIERLKGELDEKDTEISRLEKLVGDGNKVIAGHAQRISSLEKEVQEIHSLRDELEVRKHASENLRKSEATVDKMKRRLEEGEEVKERVQALEVQNKELVETNALLEAKYKELSVLKSSQAGESTRTFEIGSDGDDDDAAAEDARRAPRGRPDGGKEEERLRRDLSEQRDEVERLRLRIEELEAEVGANVVVRDVSNTSLGEASHTSSKAAERGGNAGGSLLDGLTDDQTARMLDIKQDNVLLQEQVKALDKKLVDAKQLLKEQEELRETTTTGSAAGSGSDDKRIRELEKTIDKLQHQQREADERFHLERIIALKAWKDLGRRATRPQRDVNGS